MASQRTKNRKGVQSAPALPSAKSIPLFNSFRLQAYLLALICIVFYSNTFYNGYAVDDDWVIVKNDAIGLGIAGIPQLFTADIYDNYYRQYNANNKLGGGRYRPLTLVSYAIEQQIWGQPTNELDKEAVKEIAANSNLLFARHLVNVLLYLLSVVVLLHFIRKVVFPAQPLIAFLSVLIFTIHPVHTEVVANIKSRDEILSLLFITLTLLYAWNFKESNNPLALSISLLYFFLALLSKEYAVSLLIVVPLQFYILKKYAAVKSIKTALPYLAVLVLYFILRFSVVPLQGNEEDTEVLNNPYLLATGLQKIATKTATLFNYIKLLFFPYPLSVDYSYNQLPYKDWYNWVCWLSVAAHISLIAAMVHFIRKRHVLAIALTIYLFNLFLVSNFVFNIGATMGERLIYHSSLGFSMCIAYLLYLGYNKSKPVKPAGQWLAAVMLLLVLLCAVTIYNRNKDWESNSTLYRKDVLTAGNSAITNSNAGISYLNAAPLQDNENAKREMLARAMSYFNKAIAIHPGYTFAYINRGTAYFEQGNWERAKQDWDTARSQFPTYPDLPSLYASYYINTANSKYGSNGNYEQAIEELKQGTALAPQDLIILFNMGLYYNLAGKKDSAIGSFQKIIDLKPNDTLAAKCASFIHILKKAS